MTPSLPPLPFNNVSNVFTFKAVTGMTNKERIKVISEALPEAIEKLKSLDIDGLKKLDPEDLEILENLIVFIDDIS